MNKLAYISLAGALLLSSCSDFLDTESPSEQTSSVIYENEGMAKSAIMGVYSQLAGTFVYGQKMSVNWQGVSDIELASGYNDDPSNQLTSDTGAANYWCDWYNQTIQWSYIFKMAELASTAVEGIRNSSILGTSKTMQQYLGEALTLRALSYFELVRRYGDIPYKEGTSNSDLSNVYMGKIDRDSIYPCIIKDMQEAITYLPWMGNGEYNVERISKGFAKGLLARIALTAGGWSIRDGNQFSDANVEHYPNTANNPGMAEINGYYVGRPKNWKDFYEIAEQQCAEIIGDAENPHRLDPDYGDIWKTVCGLEYNTYNENLFEVANGVGYSGDIGTLMGRGMDGNLGYGSRGWGGSYISTNGYYFYSFDPEDSRRDYACYWATGKKRTDGKYDGTGGVEEKLDNSIMNLKFGKWDFFWTGDAYRNIASTATARTPTGINWILMRYPDILLMFAEARYQLGKGEDTPNATAKISARQALEQVRARAFGEGSAKISQYDPDFFMAIVNERAWEFGCEGIRKLDLVRWGLLDTKIEEMKEAMLCMMDGLLPVKCMDKTYQPGDFPQYVYYKTFEDGKRVCIDWSSANFYRNLTGNPNPDEYKQASWFPRSYWNQTKVTETHRCVTDPVKVLICATGLRASYDYSELCSKLQYGDLILQQFRMNNSSKGNQTCNYRHVYSIYYDDIYRSKGYLKNSYGFDHSTSNE